jgi:hypothetical protein
MNNKFNNTTRVFKELQVFKECDYFCISSKDSSNRVVQVVGSKQQAFSEFSIDKTRFPVLKPCRILRRPFDDDNNKGNIHPIEEYTMDPIDKMITDGNQDANLPSSLIIGNVPNYPLVSL